MTITHKIFGSIGIIIVLSHFGCHSEGGDSKAQKTPSETSKKSEQAGPTGFDGPDEFIESGQKINDQPVMVMGQDARGSPHADSINDTQKQNARALIVQKIHLFEVFDESAFQKSDFINNQTQGLNLTRGGAISAAIDQQRIAAASAENLAKGKELIFSAGSELSLLSVGRDSSHFRTISSQIVDSPSTLFQEIKKIQPLNEKGNGVWLIGTKADSENAAADLVIRLWGKPDGRFEIISPLPR